MAATEARLYMDAVITPNRSLSSRGLKVLMGVVVAWNLVLALFFLAIGALPVPVFLGLDVAGLALAFAVSNARARRAERVQVSAEAVRVVRDAGGGPKTVWTSPTAFTRVVLEADEDNAEVQVALSGRSLSVGRALSPRERKDFAAALQRAIQAARAERG
jgi:uncharacterized membrane protein